MTNPTAKKLLIASLLSFATSVFGTSAYAQSFSLPQLPSDAAVGRVGNVFASTLMTRTVEPPSSPGRFGFGFGIGAWAVSTSQISDLLTGTSLPVIPFLNPYATLYGPLGITLDVAGLPPITIAGLRFYNVGGNLRWTFSQLLGDWFPVNLAVNLSMGTSGITYSQVLNSVNITVNSNSTQLGLDAIVSKQILFFEPYLALGFVNHTTSVGYTGTQPLFSYTAANTVSVSNFSFHTRAGFQLKALILVFGAEYEYAYSNHSGAAKIGFKI